MGTTSKFKAAMVKFNNEQEREAIDVDICTEEGAGLRILPGPIQISPGSFRSGSRVYTLSELRGLLTREPYSTVGGYGTVGCAPTITNEYVGDDTPSEQQSWTQVIPAVSYDGFESDCDCEYCSGIRTEYGVRFGESPAAFRERHPDVYPPTDSPQQG